jgi:hypothetical protein
MRKQKLKEVFVTVRGIPSSFDVRMCACFVLSIPPLKRDPFMARLAIAFASGVFNSLRMSSTSPAKERTV